MNRVEVFSSPERRRRWSRSEKERLVAAMLEPDANASDIARRAGVHTSQLFRWRRQFAAPQDVADAFVPVRIAPTGGSNPQGENMRQSTASCEAPAMTVIFPNGAHIEFREAPQAAVVAQIVGLLASSGR
jgi:transposase